MLSVLRGGKSVGIQILRCGLFWNNLEPVKLLSPLPTFLSPPSALVCNPSLCCFTSVLVCCSSREIFQKYFKISGGIGRRRVEISQLFSDFKFLNKIEFKIGLEQIWDFLNCKEKIYFILNWEDEKRFPSQNKIIKKGFRCDKLTGGRNNYITFHIFHM